LVCVDSTPASAFAPPWMSSHSVSISFESADFRKRPPGFLGTHLPVLLISSPIRERVHVLVEKAGGDDDVVQVRAELFTTWLLGLDVAVRGGADEAEIDRIVDAMRTTVDAWRH
jgi:hypothetical protein